VLDVSDDGREEVLDGNEESDEEEEAKVGDVVREARDDERLAQRHVFDVALSYRTLGGGGGRPTGVHEAQLDQWS